MTDQKHLAGAKLVLTGDFDAHTRDAATRILESFGADVTGAVSGKTTAVIVGKNAGESKLGQAKKRGLPLLNEAQMLELIAGKRLDQVLTASAASAPALTEIKSAPSAPPASAPIKSEPPRFVMPFQAPRPRDGEYIEHHSGSAGSAGTAASTGNDAIRISGFYKDGLRHGVWRKYFANGQLQEEYTWERGVKHGPELDWAETGTKICDGTNVRGKRVGTWTWRYPSGAYNNANLYDEQARRQGPYAWDLEDGTPRARGQYKDDKFDGAWTWWKEKDWEKLERVYCGGGLLHGKEIAWHHGGKLAFKRGWSDNKKHGEEEVFDAQGRPTFKGEWRHGHPVGEHIAWDAAQKETRIIHMGGLPQDLATDEKLRDKVTKKLKKAKDSYSKADVLELAGPGYRGAFLVHLWRSGSIDVAADEDLWEIFGEAVGLMSGEDVVTLLRKITVSSTNGPVLPSWPTYLDAIVMNVYQRDPAPIDAAQASLSTPMKYGVALVRARFGHDIGNALHDAMPALVKRHVEHYGLQDVLWPDADGRITPQKLFSDFRFTKTPLFHQLLAFFGTFEAWVAALEERALATAASGSVGRISFTLFRDVIERATPETVAMLMGSISLDSETENVIRLALTTWRSDDAATTARIALGVKDSGLRKWPAVAIAIAKHIAEGVEPPQELVDALELVAESPTSGSNWYTDALKNLDDTQKRHPGFRVAYVDASVGAAWPRSKLVRDAMASLSPVRARGAIERTLAQTYGKISAAQYLHLVDDPALWERFLDIAEADSYGHHDTTVYGLGEVGLRIVPLLVARLERATKKPWKEGYEKAILGALARHVVDSGELPAELDRFVRFDVMDDDATYRAYAPSLERILWRLPTARAEAILSSGLSSKPASAFARAFALIACAPTKLVLEKAFAELLSRESKLKYEQKAGILAGVASLDNAVDWVRWFRKSGGGANLADILKDAIGWQAHEGLEKELAAANAPQIVVVDQVEKLRLHAEEAGGGSERIYLLKRVDKASASDAILRPHNVIGGAAPGVDASRWPSFDDEPMAHLFTLDTDTMPELRDRVGKDVRTISVFCWHPDMNQAYESDTKQTAVVLTTAEQLKESEHAAPPEDAELRSEERFEVVAANVSPAVWSSRGGLHDEIYACHGRVLGEPIWLQGDEEGGGPLLMQFDEGFCSMNLGDGGVMYVFQDTAWWVCH